MNAIIKQIQEALEHGRPLSVNMGPLGAQVIKEIQKCAPSLEESISKRKYNAKTN